jgi:predicted nucleotidyltransferase
LTTVEVDAEAEREIARRLDAVEKREGVRILFAVESGSRAWGFPSPDSDYDVRFVYVRDIERYLTLDPPRDVVEEPIELPYDVNGWDLKKALGLALASNPVLLEWLTSPIVYRERPGQRPALAEIAVEALRRRALVHHYLGLGVNSYERSLTGETVQLKKLFYVLRPVFALQWLLDQPDRRTPPPMHFPTLMTEIALEPWLRELVGELLENKAATREMGEGKLDPRVAALSNAVFERSRSALADMLDGGASGEIRERANVFFRRVVLEGFLR